MTCIFISLNVAADTHLIDPSKCLSISNDQNRLACYDQLSTEHSNSDSPSLDAINNTVTQQVQHKNLDTNIDESRETDTASITTSQLPPKPTPRQAQKEFLVTAIIVEARQVARKKWLLKLDNGQTWVEIEPGRNRYKVGAKVRIESSFLGSYSLASGKQRIRKFRPIY